MVKKGKVTQKIMCRQIDFNDGYGIYQLDDNERICDCKIINKDCKFKYKISK